MNVSGHSDSFNCKRDSPRARPILAKDSMALAYSISVYLRRNKVLMLFELSESSPDQAGSIQPSPLVGPYAISSVL